MPPDPTILAFDTSAAHCAAALLTGGRIVARAHEPMARGQAERLIPMLEETLEGAGLGWADLDALAVGVGPGNFTGIRIAVSAARGLALSLGVPAIGVTGFEALAEGLDTVVVASIDARQDRLYVQVRNALDGAAPVLCDLERLPAIPARAEPVCVGHRAEEIAARCAGTAATARFPIAEAIARRAALRLSGAKDLPRPAPLYIRPADAAPPRDPAPPILP